jgi:hypothetical protein
MGVGVGTVAGMWVAESCWESRSVWSCSWGVIRVRSCLSSSSSSSSERGGSEAELLGYSWGRSQEGRGHGLEMVGDYVIVAREEKFDLLLCLAWVRSSVASKMDQGAHRIKGSSNNRNVLVTRRSLMIQRCQGVPTQSRATT